MEKKHYGILALMVGVHFIAMYAIMYAMVDSFDHVFPNINNFYMAGMMTAPMLLMEVVLMKEMYQKKAWNWIIGGSAVAILVLFWIFTRQQTAVGDSEFLRSMIPHHSGAILMCEEAAIERADIRELCDSIVKAQKEEIAQMQAILEKMNQGE